MQEQPDIHEMVKRSVLLDFYPQKLHTTIWDSSSSTPKGVIAALHGLTSHGEQCFHYLGPYLSGKGWTTIAIDMPGFGHWYPQERRGEKQHWAMGSDAITSLLKFCKDYACNQKIILLASSIGCSYCADYILNQKNQKLNNIDAVVLVCPTIIMKVPIHLRFLLQLGLFINPNFRLQVKRFEIAEKSHDPESIILKDDPLTLENVTLAYLNEAYKSIQSTKSQLNRWPVNLPICIFTAGLDNIVNPIHVKEFYSELNPAIFSRFYYYGNSTHYMLYESIREDLFDKVDKFFTEIPKRRF